MLVRPATTRDARAIARIQVRGWQIGYRGIVPDDYLARFTVEERANRWLASLATPTPMQHLVAEDGDEQIVGWAAYGPNQGDIGANVGELGALYVEPERWNQGIGGALLSHAEEALRREGYREAILWTLEANQATRGFYEHRGWQFDGATDTHRSGATVVRYVKSLAAHVDRNGASE